VVTQVTSAHNLVSRHSERPIVTWRRRHSKHLAKRSVRSLRLDGTAVTRATGTTWFVTSFIKGKAVLRECFVVCTCARVSAFWLLNRTIKTWQSRNFESIRNL
jgi:hypothetical protein